MLLSFGPSPVLAMAMMVNISETEVTVVKQACMCGGNGDKCSSHVCQASLKMAGTHGDS